MRSHEARTLITDALARVAPELDVTQIDPQAELTVEADLDSMDFLSVVTQVSGRLGHEIPEHDYPRLVTLEDFATYVCEIADRTDLTTG